MLCRIAGAILRERVEQISRAISRELAGWRLVHLPAEITGVSFASRRLYNRYHAAIKDTVSRFAPPRCAAVNREKFAAAPHNFIESV